MQINKEISRKKYASFGLFGLFAALSIWSLFTYTGIIKPLFLPSQTQVILSAVKLFTESDFLHDIFVSFYRIAVGFVFSIIVAVPLGIFAGTNKSVEAFISPMAAFIRYLPTSAFVPLSILWFGIGNMEKFFIIFIGIAPYLFILVSDTIANVKKELIEAGYTLGATTKQIYTKIIIPYSLPGIWDGMRLMFGVGWTLIILVEIIGADSGLGYVVIQSQRFLQTEKVIAVIIVIGFLGLITDYLFKISYKKLFPWSEKSW